MMRYGSFGVIQVQEMMKQFLPGVTVEFQERARRPSQVLDFALETDPE